MRPAKGQGKPVSQVRFRPPPPRPENIICMAVNCMEAGTLAEPAPINAFMKSASAIIGDGDTMVLPDMAATIFEGETELAVVIGKRASNGPLSKPKFRTNLISDELKTLCSALRTDAIDAAGTDVIDADRNPAQAGAHMQYE
jgi:Fumarylacetoacetate (FAA) hydrolase family